MLRLSICLVLGSAAAQVQAGPLRGRLGKVDDKALRFEAELLTAINNARKSKKLEPFSMDEPLRNLARGQAEAAAKGDPIAQKFDERVKTQNLAPNGYRLQYVFATKTNEALRDLRKDATTESALMQDLARIGIGAFWVPEDKPYFQVAVLVVRDIDPMAGKPGLSRDQTDPVMAGAAEEIRKACYQPVLDKNPNFGGNLVFQIVISASGTVESAKYLSKTEQVTFDHCAMEIAQNLVFPAPYKGKPVTLTHPMRFAPPQGERRIGRLAGDQVTRTFGSASADFRACYDERLKANPKLKGTITLGLSVAAAGTVNKVSVETDGLGDADLATCVVERAKRLQFPTPEFDAEAQVRFPLRFEPVVK